MGSTQARSNRGCCCCCFHLCCECIKVDNEDRIKNEVELSSHRVIESIHVSESRSDKNKLEVERFRMIMRGSSKKHPRIKHIPVNSITTIGDYKSNDSTLISSKNAWKSRLENHNMDRLSDMDHILESRKQKGQYLIFPPGELRSLLRSIDNKNQNIEE